MDAVTGLSGWASMSAAGGRFVGILQPDIEGVFQLPVVVSTDGAAVRRKLGNTAPARLQVVGIVDRVSLGPTEDGR